MRLLQGEYEKNISHCRDMIRGKFFEFDFPYVSMSESFKEINRFLWESRHQCTRFRNYYEGRAVIDITEWNNHCPNDYFDAFLYFLKENESRISCTLISSVPYSQAVLSKINRLFTTQTVDLSPADRTNTGITKIGFVVKADEKEEQC